MKKRIIIFVYLLLFSACASQRPVLYPNYTLQDEGRATAQDAIDDCMRLAGEYGATGNDGSRIAKEAAENAAVAGTAGGVAGAIYDGEFAKGAAAGAAGAGAATITRGLFRSNRPDPVFHSFVERCLRDKGYQPIGWK